MPATCDEKLQGMRGAWRHSKAGRGREISTVWTNRGVQVGQSCSIRREVAGRAVRFDEAVGVSAGQSLDASAIGEGLDDDGLAAVGAANSVSTIISNFVFDTPRSASWSPLRSALRCRRVDRMEPPWGFLHAPEMRRLKPLLALTQLGMAETAERDQVPLVITAGFAAGDEVMVLQIIGRTTGGAEGELHCFALSIRSRIRCTDFGPCPVTAPIARYAAPSRRMAFIRSITAISVTFGTKRLTSPSRTMS
jgi:hypothetical protein